MVFLSDFQNDIVEIAASPFFALLPAIPAGAKDSDSELVRSGGFVDLGSKFGPFAPFRPTPTPFVPREEAADLSSEFEKPCCESPAGIVTLLLNAFILGIGGLIVKIIFNRITKKAKIEINKEVEKIKFEIQRKYLLTEIRTRNLLEVYPKLHDSVHAAAGPYVTYFTTILNKVDELRSLGKEPDENQLLRFFEDYIGAIFSEERLQNVTALRDLNNNLVSASLFISDEVSNLVSEMKNEIRGLFRLVRNEIGNDVYKTYSKEKLIDLLNRANLIICPLKQNKDRLAKRINEELDPCYQD